ncbi:MAG: orotidine-5'-phosphate decarboxylase [Gemmatimonadetes bacterium]|nr:orotidine-5'-phosphate decarboxylase [Gemmatimonadota bacterium]
MRESGSLVCVGLDPDPGRMPVRDAGEFGRRIVDTTRDLVCAYKMQLAYYEALGLEGLRALEVTVRHVREAAPGVVIVGDAKRGDIGSTARAYASAMFDVWGFDVVTVQAYLGRDSLEPFVERGDRGALVVCRTSNPGARDVQDLRVDGVPVYRWVAALAEECNGLGNVGLVVGATYPSELEELRGAYPEMPFLVPGVGAQGGDAGAAARLGAGVRGGRCMIASSRGIIYASADGGSYARAAREAVMRMRGEISAGLAGGRGGGEAG